MTDLATPETPSTVIDTGESPSAAGAGTPNVAIEGAEKAVSQEDAIKEAFAATAPKKEDAPADADDKDADKAKGAEKAKEGAEKPQGEEKAPKEPEDKKAPDRGADGKFAAKEKEPEKEGKGEADHGQRKQAEMGMRDAPQRFLPDAKEKWANVPREVRRDVETLVREHETEVTRYREAAERYEPIRQYDEMVRQNGRAGIHETLAEVAQLEDLIAQNPLAGLNQVLLRVGPRKPDGSPVSLFEVAQTIVQMGQQGYNQAVTRAAQQPPAQNDNPRIQQLEQQLAQLQQQQLAASVIEPFRASHPRYDELAADIALFLKSGKIPDSLSPHERLEAAYDMAARINPASHVSPAEPEADPVTASRAASDLSGSKSIKSAPGAVSAEMEPDRGGEIEDLLREEIRRVRGR